ncbi:hypothetical protein Nepgr_004003 [Nepenthes gracilis]|uniref:Secreted protein n=1 Tax=Nepenthes gracilis TaxID=150966 RepID=A0AAD3S0N2_NEPGR|nr:hypothetical protein Nepgr_004003 [Nepenthes gracilis]
MFDAAVLCLLLLAPADDIPCRCIQLRPFVSFADLGWADGIVWCTGSMLVASAAPELAFWTGSGLLCPWISTWLYRCMEAEVVYMFGTALDCSVELLSSFLCCCIAADVLAAMWQWVGVRAPFLCRKADRLIWCTGSLMAVSADPGEAQGLLALHRC